MGSELPFLSLTLLNAMSIERSCFFFYFVQYYFIPSQLLEGSAFHFVVSKFLHGFKRLFGRHENEYKKSKTKKKD